MAIDPKVVPDKGKDTKEEGTSKETQKWEELGFESEDAMVDAAKEATGLRSKVVVAETTAAEEKAKREKTSDEFRMQSTEVGNLRIRLKKLGAPTEVSRIKAEDEPTDEELIESLSTEDATHFDEVLDKPENLELKKAVATGGAKAMAEFIRSFNKNAPLDFKAPVFASLKKKKSDYVAKNSIANMVKSLFEQEETTLKNKLPATSPAGSPSDGDTKTKKVSAIGTITAGFYDGTKPKG